MENIKKVDMIWKQITDLLPKKPESGIFWTNGEEILSEDESEIEAIANLFDQMYGEGTVNTGYYDDEVNDQYRGWYYCNNV